MRFRERKSGEKGLEGKEGVRSIEEARAENEGRREFGFG